MAREPRRGDRGLGGVEAAEEEEVGCWLSLKVEPRGTFDELESIPPPPKALLRLQD